MTAMRLPEVGPNGHDCYCRRAPFVAATDTAILRYSISAILLGCNVFDSPIRKDVRGTAYLSLSSQAPP